MAKDPALLWYFNDWTGGTVTLSRHVKGCYIDLLAAQFNSGPLSLDEIKTVLGSDFGPSWPALQKKFAKDDNGCYYNVRLQEEKDKRVNYTNSRRQSRLKSDEDQVKLYIVKDLDSGNVKIGSSVNPMRRFAELCNQQNPAITLGEAKTNRNYCLMWYSRVVERTEEKVVHDKFNSKRLVGEWFKLDDLEIQSITDSYDGTYVNHTENVNENRNKNEYGEFKNVFLTNDEHRKLRASMGQERTDELIEELSLYIKSIGKDKYKDHYATLLNWSRRKKQKAVEGRKTLKELNV